MYNNIYIYIYILLYMYEIHVLMGFILITNREILGNIYIYILIGRYWEIYIYILRLMLLG